MSLYFFDSSGIAKRYVREAGTDFVLAMTDPAQAHYVYLARITGAEVVSALARLQRSGFLPSTVAADLMNQFRDDFSHQYRLVEVTGPVIHRAMLLAERHALRGYDAVQLAAALELSDRCAHLGIASPTLVSSDTALNAAAHDEGLSVIDPNSQSHL